MEVNGAEQYQRTTGQQANKYHMADANIGKDTFLQLLVTQIKNQNPLEPMDDKEFLSQMAQFSSLEQMQNLNTTMKSQLTNITDTITAGYKALMAINNNILIQQNLQAINLLGGDIIAEVRTEGQQSVIIDGTVKRVSFNEGRVKLQIDDSTVYMDEIINLEMKAR